MQVILHPHTQDAPWQQLRQEWYGNPVEPPVEFRFRLTADALIFSARRPAPALLHPDAREGQFQSGLWRYDTAEFYIANAEGNHYLEFNLAPNGAWWSAAFLAPRVADPTMPAEPQGVCAHGHADTQGWSCEAAFPLSYLRHMGIDPAQGNCRLAATAILSAPARIFLTTAADTEGAPDFHRPGTWEPCLSPRKA